MAEIKEGKLSIIIPFVNEFPQVAFTVNDLWCEVRDEIDFEIICIDNWCKEAADQKREQDRGSEYMGSIQKIHPWLTVIKYDKKLSHWQAKNAGVRASSGEFLWFSDAHCIVSKNALVRMFKYYQEHHKELNGTLHLPLTYMLDRPHSRLIYKLVADLSRGILHYSFTRYRESEKPYAVPCMSTCGMMMTRELYDLLGGWPELLGIYGGGENFINFTLAVLGKSVNIFPEEPLFHYAAPRGYHWNYDDWVRNRMIAAYVSGGEAFGWKFVENCRGRPPVLNRLYLQVLDSEEVHRKHIEKNIKTTLEEWIQNWEYAIPEVKR